MIHQSILNRIIRCPSASVSRPHILNQDSNVYCQFQTDFISPFCLTMRALEQIYYIVVDLKFCSKVYLLICKLFFITHLSLASHKRDLANSVDQTPHYVASDQSLSYLHQIQKFLQNMVLIKTSQTPL